MKYSLSSFARGFNQSYYATSIVNTGKDKGSTDEALKCEFPILRHVGESPQGEESLTMVVPAHIEWHMPGCDWLLIGGAHDGGYAASIPRLGRSLRSRIILLPTGGFVAPRIAALELESVRFGGLFDGRDATSYSKRGTSGELTGFFPA